MIANRAEKKKLTRTVENRNITGVCAGISSYINVDVSIIRLIFIIFLLFNITTLVVYIFATAIMPQNTEEFDESIDDQKLNIKIYVVAMSFIFVGLLIIAKYLEIPFFFNLWNLPLLLSLGIMILFIGTSIFGILKYLNKENMHNLVIKRDASNQMISGVFAGIAKSMHIDVTIIRLIVVTFCLLFFHTIPLAAILYSLAAINLEYES